MKCLITLYLICKIQYWTKIAIIFAKNRKRINKENTSNNDNSFKSKKFIIQIEISEKSETFFSNKTSMIGAMDTTEARLAAVWKKINTMRKINKPGNSVIKLP